MRLTTSSRTWISAWFVSAISDALELSSIVLFKVSSPSIVIWLPPYVVSLLP